MAIYPCQGCGQRFKGEAENLYVQHFKADQVESYRLLLCEPCVDDRLEEARSKGLYRDGDGEWAFVEDNTEPKWQSAPRGRLSGRR